jgi:RimJ/RimL family protein N-acetyltransferase
MKPIPIGIADIVLRRFRSDDGPALVRHADNPAVARNLRDVFPNPYTARDAEAWLEMANDDTRERSFAIATPDEVIGGIGLKREFDVNRLTNEVGYWLGEAYWGRGIATAAVQAITAWAFRELDIVRIWGGVYSSNPASCRVLEKAGYDYEGTLRRSVIKNGVILDQRVYARLRPE